MPFVPADDGSWVSESFERLARVVQDYDHNIELRWIPHEQREMRDDKKPYVIWDKLANLPVIYASELDNPVDILDRLFQADNKHGNVLTKLESRNRAQEIMDMKERMDAYEEMEDQAKFLHQSPINYMNWGKGVKLDDQRRRIS